MIGNRRSLCRDQYTEIALSYRLGVNPWRRYRIVIDGCPAGLPIEDVIRVYLDRRKPGRTEYATPRKEDDRLQILSVSSKDVPLNAHFHGDI